jgi:hypothetical protein
MTRFFSRRPSPAMAVAFIALLAALSGTAVALPGKNTVDSGDLKRNSVKAADIARNAVTGPKIRNGAVTAAKVRNNSLTGADINESTLGQVPSANTANTANHANTANTANHANTANTANHANTANNANTANAANNASQLGGVTLRGLLQWVLVDTAGNVVRSSGGVTAVQLAAAGRYRVTFPTNVSNCAYNANAGSSGDASDGTDFSNRMVMLGRSTTAPTDVQVETTNDAGVEAYNPFYLTVQC